MASFDSSTVDPAIDSEHRKGIPNNVSPSYLTKLEERNQNCQSVISIQELYEKPGKITNQKICEINESTQEVQLKS